LPVIVIYLCGQGVRQDGMIFRMLSWPPRYVISEGMSALGIVTIAELSLWQNIWFTAVLGITSVLGRALSPNIALH
jgi:hypothetical protein